MSQSSEIPATNGSGELVIPGGIQEGNEEYLPSSWYQTTATPMVSPEASRIAQMEKNLPAMWETRVPSLGKEDTLEKEMATHTSILAWRIPWTE